MTTTTIIVRNAATADLLAEWGYGMTTPYEANQELAELLPALHRSRADALDAQSLAEAIAAEERFAALDARARGLAWDCRGMWAAEEYERWFGAYGNYWEDEMGEDA